MLCQPRILAERWLLKGLPNLGDYPVFIEPVKPRPKNDKQTKVALSRGPLTLNLNIMVAIWIPQASVGRHIDYRLSLSVFYQISSYFTHTFHLVHV